MNKIAENPKESNEAPVVSTRYHGAPLLDELARRRGVKRATLVTAALDEYIERNIGELLRAA